MVAKILGLFRSSAVAVVATMFSPAVLPAFAHAQAHQPVDAPQIPFISVPDFLKYPPSMNLGEVLGVAVNSKGHIVILNHPGTATTGPLFGNATTQLLEFDADGNFVREIGHGVYGLGYGHAVRFDAHDNLWVADKGTDSVMKFNPAGYVVMNLGRRPEGYDSGREPGMPKPADAVASDGWFAGVTDVGWDAADNIYISDGYTNSRIAKYDKNGDWLTTWGSYGVGGEHGDENPGKFRNPHNLQVDANGQVYVADRANRRIQVFDGSGKFLRFILLNVRYDKTHHPTLGSLPKDPSTRPDETEPWAMCITKTFPQYLYAVDAEPGRIYKMTLQGKILGVLGISGHQLGQFNWAHSLACPTENVVFVADMNNWRLQKLLLYPGKTNK